MGWGEAVRKRGMKELGKKEKADDTKVKEVGSAVSNSVL